MATQNNTEPPNFVRWQN